MKEKDCQQKWSAKTPPAKGNSRFLSPSRSSHFTWSPSLGLNKTLGNQWSHGNPKRVTRANYFTSAQTTSSMGNFHHEIGKKKLHYNVTTKKFWRKNSGNSSITKPCTWDQGRRNLRSLGPFSIRFSALSSRKRNKASTCWSVNWVNHETSARCVENVKGTPWLENLAESRAIFRSACNRFIQGLDVALETPILGHQSPCSRLNHMKIPSTRST